MKRHDEGYALVLVLVVLVVLGLLASFLLTFSLRGLEVQTNSAQRMQEQYEAAGEIEKTVACLQALAKDPAAGAVPLKNEEYLADTGKLVLTRVSGRVQITCTLKLTGAVVEEGEVRQLTAVEYTAYEISMVEEETDDA